MACPLCNKVRNQKLVKGQVYRCGYCGAIYGSCYLGESYEYVLPYMTAADPEMSKSKYFDFVCLGSDGITRRHGWFDPESHKITQIG